MSGIWISLAVLNNRDSTWLRTQPSDSLIDLLVVHDNVIELKEKKNKYKISNKPFEDNLALIPQVKT